MSNNKNKPKSKENSNNKPDETRQGRGRDRIGHDNPLNNQGGGRMRTKQKREGDKGDS
jgi:hypothetical protein